MAAVDGVNKNLAEIEGGIALCELVRSCSDRACLAACVAMNTSSHC